MKCWTEKPEFVPGERVQLVSTGECGIVVHVWLNEEEGGFYDCYVAFFGHDFPLPNQRPTQIPHILRYAETSLCRIPVI